MLRQVGKMALQAVTPLRLTESIPGVSIEEARKIIGAVHRRDGPPSSIAMVRSTSLAAVRAAGFLPRLAVHSVTASSLDPFIKFAFVTPDGCLIETVRIPLERQGRFTVCVSSQAGCGLGCEFCATGQAGFECNLETWEIVEQVREVRRGLDRTRRQRVHGVVFQGMGEPLANLDCVIDAIRVICEPSALAVDGRTVTVCTAGIPEGIRRLAREAPKVRLGVSIGSARPGVRRALMPIDRAHPLDAVLDAAAEHARVTGLAPMWGITLLAGTNDTAADALALAARARDFTQQAGLRPQIRIIPYNPIRLAAGEPFRRSDEQTAAAFGKLLRAEGFCAHRRYSGGADICAACGQLAARSLQRTSSEVGGASC